MGMPVRYVRVSRLSMILPTQKEFISLITDTRFRYIHDVTKATIQGNAVLDLSLNENGYGIFFTVNGFPSTGKADESRILSLNAGFVDFDVKDRKSARLNSSHQIISYAVFCLKKKKTFKRTKS